MKHTPSSVVRSLVILLIGCGTLAASLQAQFDSSVTVRVPFPFTVGTQTIPAGTYQFSLLSSQFLLSVLNVKTGEQEMFSVHPERQRAIAPQGRIVFHNSEGSSVLSQIYFPGSYTFSEINQRHDARRLEAKKSSTDTSISVAQR